MNATRFRGCIAAEASPVVAQVNALVKACFVNGKAVPDADALIAKLA